MSLLPANRYIAPTLSHETAIRGHHSSSLLIPEGGKRYSSMARRANTCEIVDSVVSDHYDAVLRCLCTVSLHKLHLADAGVVP